jgi:hypothetical protein
MSKKIGTKQERKRREKTNGDKNQIEKEKRQENAE